MQLKKSGKKQRKWLPSFDTLLSESKVVQISSWLVFPSSKKYTNWMGAKFQNFSGYKWQPVSGNASNGEQTICWRPNGWFAFWRNGFKSRLYLFMIQGQSWWSGGWRSRSNDDSSHNALAFMVRRLRPKWKQALGYILTSQHLQSKTVSPLDAISWYTCTAHSTDCACQINSTSKGLTFVK